MLATPLRLGPADHGRTMKLEEYLDADFAEGFQYELGQGCLIVNEVANPPHFHQVQAVIEQMVAYKLSHPGVIQSFGGGSESRLFIESVESDRHPDFVIYKTPAPSRRRDCAPGCESAAPS